MPIFRAFGLGITILILQLLVPVIFSQLQNTIIAFLKAGEVSANVGSQIAGSAAAIQFSGLNAPPALPRVANITR
ncbi:MAG TPA: hypothetical protein VGN56_02870 [Candidatus Paceibacterota bacterium]|jgi:hypothetical protein|nr:hypothetical protein [Candidatus Paceibacterota bacterium]